MINLIKKYPLISFFILTYLINWIGLAFNVAGFIPTFGEWPLVYDGHQVAVLRGRRSLLNWSPNFAAMIVLWATSGFAGICDLFRKFFVWRVGLKWWLFALLLPIFIVFMAVGMHILSGGKFDFSMFVYFPMVLFLRSIFSLSTGGIGEEAGWRGFALPRLQKRFSPLASSIIIGFIWGFWHASYGIIRGWNPGYIVCFMLSVICLSIFLTWLYNRTQESLLIVAAAHNMINTIIATLTVSFASVISNEEFMPMFALAMVAFVSILIVVSRGRL